MTATVNGSGTVGPGCIHPYLAPQDRVRIEVDLLGTLDTRIVPGRSFVPLR